MSQFFGTNPASRPAAGPREGNWPRETPKDWRTALGVSQGEKAPAGDATEGEDS